MLGLLKYYILSILVLNSIFIILVQDLCMALIFVAINYLIVTVALFALELEFLSYTFSIIYTGRSSSNIINNCIVSVKKKMETLF